jgi:type IV fimbrial biogenesis protein FimT
MPKFLKNERGATLLEICLCLSLIIILNGVAPPQLQNFKSYFDSRSTQKSLLSFLGLARSRALHRQQIVTLCPLAEGSRCIGQWSEQLAIFVDQNSNAVRDANEELLSTWQELPSQANLTWTLDRRYIRFRPNGTTSATTGSLRYCLSDRDSTHNFRIVVARTGRTRVDRNSHGCS